MSKPRVAIFDFACCEGCQLQIVNLEEELIDLLTIVEPVEWREAMSEQSEDYDIAIVEGSITRPEDEERLRVIRDHADILVALGACATQGGLNRLKNRHSMDKVREVVYGEDGGMSHLETAPTKGLDEVVKVDYRVEGCPIDPREFAYVVRCLAIGKKPVIPDYPVCVECRAKGNVCRFEYGEVCLGPITRAGCDACCPTAGTWCFGCRGYLPYANVGAAKEIMDMYGKTVEDLEARMDLFGTK